MKTEEILSMPVALPDGIDYDDYIIGTYNVTYPAAFAMPKLAPLLAVEQSTGTWVPVPGETPEVRRNHIAKVIGVYEMPDHEYGLPQGLQERNWVVQIAFPVVNIGSQIPMLLTTVVGNISMAGQVKLVDVRFPKKYVAGFKGPKFGIDGVRKLLGVKKRPLLNNMIKPCTGYKLEMGAELFRQAALGGCDIIKDDELIADASFNSILGRVKRYKQIEQEVFEKTGEHTLYSVNISDSVPKIFDNAKKAVECGANALMINYIAVGLPVLQAIAEDPDINVPILAHMDVAGAMYMSPYHGISSHIILGKLPRLAGADIVVIPAPYGKAPILAEKFDAMAKNLTYPLYNLKPSWPMASGGITPSMVPKVMQELGTDIVIGSGGGIHAHPQGPIAGGKAFRQAIDATMKGVSLEEYAKTHKELAASIQAWTDPFKKGV